MTGSQYVCVLRQLCNEMCSTLRTKFQHLSTPTHHIQIFQQQWFVARRRRPFRTTLIIIIVAILVDYNKFAEFVFTVGELIVESCHASVSIGVNTFFLSQWSPFCCSLRFFCIQSRSTSNRTYDLKTYLIFFLFFFFFNTQTF